MKHETKPLERIGKIVKEKRGILTEQFKVKEIGIFGSMVRGKDEAASNVDILVEFREPIGLFKFLELKGYLGDLIGRKVDLVSKKALKPRIGKHILNEVVLLGW